MDTELVKTKTHFEQYLDCYTLGWNDARQGLDRGTNRPECQCEDCQRGYDRGFDDEIDVAQHLRLAERERDVPELDFDFGHEGGS